MMGVGDIARAVKGEFGAVALAIGILGGCAGCLTAHAHTFGDGEADLTPPMRAQAEDLEALKRDFSGSASALRGVFTEMQLWSAGSTLSACFYDGDNRLKAFFARVAREWLRGTSLSINFGTAPEFSRCDTSSTDELRITFAEKGNWSYVGTDSLHSEIVKRGASLNIQTDGRPFDKLDLTRMKEVVLHEMGHALGLLHEHQSPQSRCGDEFDWPGIYSYAKSKWGWDEDKVKTNFAIYHDLPRLRTTAYDKSSIMHYALPDWMFKRGQKSRCFISQNQSLSQLDRTAIRAAYPQRVSQQDRHLQKLASSVGTIMGKLQLDARQVARAGARISVSLRHIKRPVKLEFSLVPGKAVRRSADGSDLNPCTGDKLRVSDVPSVSCGVVSDGSGLVIEIHSTR